MARQALTDAQSWLIACSPDLPAPVIAEATGVKFSTVRNARARFRAKGFTCRVAYVPCRGCGGFLTQRGFRSGRAAYHLPCRVEARREIQHRLDQERWQRLGKIERDQLLHRLYEADLEYQQDTRKQASNAYARWSAQDDTYLIGHWHKPAHHLAPQLGRALYAIRARRHILRSRGLTPPH